ncbi:Uncharacterised protein [Zhongshania aliphaticivorans]|uniref:CENP-V/GFA domain-containing protein n=1 Tax=Zhongshania aliphaticivorans TaxID=1470434 RepID=A0A5S9Q7U7_9GAMM|nr:GFA family protein [Zhongshania aliphaticivorans]CAA0103591.1 Uncharacterised protein [Zhongshania aliphaticivorans]CAA0113415.1 Uncharacterised protein [Zhongshania aliphaticivorans]
MKTHQARCACGEVRYEFCGQPYTVYACHCTRCQQRTGSAFGLTMIVPANAITFVGKGLAEDMSNQSGPLLYCDTCRSLMAYKSAPDTYCVFPGAFDDKTWFKPVANIWVRSAQPWVTIDQRLKCYEENPNYAELYKLYKGAS